MMTATAADDYVVVKLVHNRPLDLAIETIHWYFGDDATARRLANFPAEAYYRQVAKAQDEINARMIPRALAWQLRHTLALLLESDDIMLQSIAYLRAARPADRMGIVDFHRESFYGAPPQAFNVWVPLLNVTPENTLRYVPGSSTIPGETLLLETQPGAVEPGSAGHKIGLLYAPKKIVAGVDLGKAETMAVPDGCAAIFPGELVHGAAVNNTDRIRFSIDMRVIAREHLASAHRPIGNLRTGYFIPLREAA